MKDAGYGLTFQDPLIEVLESSNAPVKSRSIGRLLAVYPLTEGVGADRFRSLIEQVLPLAKTSPDPLSDQERSAHQLLPLGEALRALHCPTDREELDQARRRLVFDEFLLLQLGLLRRRRELRSRPAPQLDLSVMTEGLWGASCAAALRFHGR